MAASRQTALEAATWVRDARSDLAMALVPKKRNIRYEHLCFHAQQAAEKSLKAVLIISGLDVPRTHDLTFLMDRLPKEHVIPLDMIDVPVLTKYAVQCRYPGQEVEVSRRDYRRAVTLAETTLRWAARVCRHRK